MEKDLVLFLKANKKNFHKFLLDGRKYDKKLISQLEHKWGRLKITFYKEKNYCNVNVKENTNQWSNIVSECLIKHLLEIKGEKVWKPKKKKDDIGNVVPDLETDKAVYEVKTRNYCTSGTAGEKTLGTALKYINVPELYNKPLYIVLVGYAEEEYKNLLLNTEKISEKRRNVLKYYQTQNIFYIGASSLF